MCTHEILLADYTMFTHDCCACFMFTHYLPNAMIYLKRTVITGFPSSNVGTGEKDHDIQCKIQQAKL